MGLRQLFLVKEFTLISFIGEESVHGDRKESNTAQGVQMVL